MARTNTTQLVDTQWYYPRERYRVLKVWIIYDMGITWLFRLSNDYEMTMRTLIITERFDRRQLRSI